MEKEKNKLIPPKDFFKIKEKSIEEIKAKISSSDTLSKYFILVELNKTVSRTSLTQEIKSAGINSYPQKTKRKLKELTELKVLESKQVFQIDRNSLSEIDKIILAKHENFLKTTTNPFNQKYEDTHYYYLSNIGYEILPFIAKKLNFNFIK